MPEKFKPRYIYWYEDDFQSSLKVTRRLTWLQRHLYRTLCAQAMFCDTRPYLPVKDAELRLLADCDEATWEENRDAVMSMFTLMEDKDGETLGWSHPRIIRDWKRQKDAIAEKSRAGKSSGRARAEQALNRRSAGVKQTETETDTTPDHTTVKPHRNHSKASVETETEAEQRARRASASSAASLSIQDGRDFDSEMSGSDRLSHGGSSQNRKDAKLLFEQWCEYATGKMRKPVTENLCLPTPVGADVIYMETLIEEKGAQFVERVMHWALGVSDYWGKRPGGELKGVAGFAKAFDAIAQQYTRYREAAKTNRRK